MDWVEIRKTLDKLSVDIDAIEDKSIRDNQRILLNLVETLVEMNVRLTKTNQELKDEINRLKGEQGKPDIRANKKDKGTDNANHSSEKDRKPRGKQPRKPKINKKKTVIWPGKSTATLREQ